MYRVLTLNLLVTCLTIPKNLSHSCSKEKQLFDSEEELDEISERPRTTRNVSNKSNTAPQARLRSGENFKKKEKAKGP